MDLCQRETLSFSEHIHDDTDVIYRLLQGIQGVDGPVGLPGSDGLKVIALDLRQYTCLLDK